MKLLFLIFLLFRLKCGIVASSHWVVTENGLIQPLLDSPFQMRVPNDLMGFLDQEKRLSEIDGIFKSLKDFVFDKPFLEGSTIPLNSHKTNYYCEKTSIGIDDVDLYMSIAADGSDRNGIKLTDFFADSSLRNIYGTEVPKCEKSSSLPFSMFTFEHLKAMMQRHNLSLAPEHSLHEWLLPGTSVTSFGHHVALGLLHNSTSWLHYNLAAIYWRIKGEASKAIECCRRAVYFAPREYRDIPLLNMGSIFHQTKNSADAAIVLHSAVDHDPVQPANYFALGNVYAVLEDYNQSVACYDNVLKLKPSFKQAQINKYALLCKAHHVNELLELNDAVQNKYAEVRNFLKLREDWQKLEEKLMNALTPLGIKSLSQQVDQHDESQCTSEAEINMENSNSLNGWRMKSSSRMFSNMLVSHQAFNPFEIIISIQLLLKNLETELKRLSPHYQLSEDFALVKASDLNEYSTNVEKINNEFVDTGSTLVPPLVFYMNDANSVPTPNFDATTTLNTNKVEGHLNIVQMTLPVKYRYNTRVSRVKQEFDTQNDWPSQSQCDEWIPQITKRVGKMGEPLEPLPVYLPVENKGYDAKLILSKYIGMDSESEHPLPWYPPLCCANLKPNLKSTYLPSALLAKSKSPPILLSDNKLRKILFSYVSDNNSNEAEIGQRILTAIKKNVAPKWVLYTLASLYWRVRSNVQNTLDCLLCAIEHTPDSNKDVPLTSLGSVLFELGYPEESIKVTAEAYNSNKIEPATNFLLSMLHKSKNNVLGQLYHMKQVIRVDTDFMNGWAYSLLRGWHCIAKTMMKLKFSGVEEATKEKSNEVCSDVSKEKINVGSDTFTLLQGDILGMVCNAGGESCHPANIQCYKTETIPEDDEEDLLDLFSDGTKKRVKKAELHCFPTTDRSSKNLDKDASCKLSKDDEFFDTGSNSDMSIPGMTKNSPIIVSLEQRNDIENKENIKGKFELNLIPPDDLDEEIKNIGSMKVDGETFLIEEADVWVTKMHIYDDFISLNLSEDICAKMENVEVFKTSNFWSWYSDREFVNFARSVFKDTHQLSDFPLKPSCTAPQSDFIQEALGVRKLPEFNPYTKHIFTALIRKITQDDDLSDESFGDRIAQAIKQESTSWVLHFLAAIYWRNEGNPDLVLTCLRQSLDLAPEQEKDLPLLGLSFMFQWLEMEDDSIKLSRLAYSKRPDFVVNLFHIALIHAHKGELEHAIHTLRLVIARDGNFKVAQKAINELLCLLLFGLNDFLKEGTFLSLLKVFL